MCRFRDQDFVGALLQPSSSITPEPDKVFSAASEAGLQLVKEGFISSNLLNAISKQYISEDDYIDSINKYFKKIRINNKIEK